MNDVTVAKVWHTLICYPRLPFNIVAKRCSVTTEEVEKAARVMGSFANGSRRK